MNRLSKYFGPSTLIAAAFIGPGTITTCTLAGVEFGYELLWALVFSTFATLVLQEMSSRLGFVSSNGLAEAIRNTYDTGIMKYLAIALVVSAILIGNAAYEAGNISGAVLGIELLSGPFYLWPMIVALISFSLLWRSNYKILENVLIALVLLMSISFLVTAIIVQPDLTDIFNGLIPRKISNDELLIMMGLIGTTVVPYNLFLHASLIRKKYGEDSELSTIRKENLVSIGLGGIISILIVIVAAASRESIGEVNSAKDLALQLEPLLGSHARSLMGLGLIAAGFSSALTAALAAAYVYVGITGKSQDESSLAFKSVWIFILLLGTIVSLTKINMVLIIKFAQIANALILPLLAIFLFRICNSQKIMGKHINSKTSNALSIVVILLTVALSLKTLLVLF